MMMMKFAVISAIVLMCYVSYASPFTYAGCFDTVDNLEYFDVSLRNTNLSLVTCVNFCDFYEIVLIYEYRCFCRNGSGIEKYRTNETNCDIRCSDFTNQSCGGNWFYSVYYINDVIQNTTLETLHGPNGDIELFENNTLETPLESNEPNEDIILQPSSEFPSSSGCYIDYPNRILDGPRIESDDMTVEKCINYCTDKNYYFAGLEYSRECFCGNIIKLTDMAHGVDCSATCTGDPTQKCGGTWHISVYKAKPLVYVGCYNDLPNVNLLEGPWIQSANMTKEKCVRYCNIRSNDYAGLRNSEYCYCGNHAISANLQDKVNDADCSENCAGDSFQKCGSSMHFSVYQAKPTFIYHGCFNDTRNRILEGSMIASDDMTVEKCVNFCGQENNTFAGVESARQCFCGDTITTTEKEDDSKCSAPCAGDTSQKCGGTWSISMYEILAN